MNRIVILSLIALAAIGIGLLQQHRLAGLKREFSQVSRERVIPPGSWPEGEVTRTRIRVGAPRSSAQTFPQISLTDLARQMADLWLSAGASDARVRRGTPETSGEQSIRNNSLAAIYRVFAKLEPTDAMELIHHLETNPDLPKGFLEDGPARGCVLILKEVNPKVLLDIIPRLKDYPKPEEAMSDGFHGWLRENPVAAVKWFDDETGKGNPLIQSARLIHSVIMEEMKFDPTHALGRVLSQIAAEGPESRLNLGANIAMQLGEPDENIAFFTALRRESERTPDSRVLSDIRDTYVGQFGRGLPQWPAEVAITFLNTEFTPAEKTAVARELVGQGDLDEPEKWAAWMYRVDPTSEGKHPLEDFMSGWLRTDPGGARSWLEQAPSGDLKDRLLRKYPGKPE